ncbi:hypothetical protein PROFUN_02165 [Planoprotostelium fungivorum]|uniref:RING-type domain-containing protein n=1 Tax=Planoprotostelium fungivorum TaxID=1890364 RepID=A0A2P6NZB1_9EUKA|nr:hypothetical protein PROFUN_02165 [Planoprotostelium fungivorum]
MVDDQCLACKNNTATYSPVGCDHIVYCSSCAMKLATGGKCKQCGQMFAQLKKRN